MASYQDIETRLKTVEDKIDFVMTTFTVTKESRSRLMPAEVIRETKTLLDVYREVKSTNLEIFPISPAPESNEVKDGVVAE